MSDPSISAPIPPTIVALDHPNPEKRKIGLPREGVLWLLVTVGLLITGLFKGINLIILLAYMMIAVIAGNWWLSRRHLQGLSAKRNSLGSIFAGKPSGWELEISNTSSKSIAGWIIHDFGPHHELAWFGARLEPNQRASVRGEVTLPKRGKYRTGPIVASTRYPFGLISRVVELAPEEERIVLPKLGIIEGEQFRHWLSRIVRGDGRIRQRIRHLVASEAEIHGLRPFRIGDSPRWIHWRTSARRNELMVREFEDSSPPNLTLVVEPFMPSSPSAEDQKRLEWIISLSASICREWCRDAESRFALIISTANPVILPSGGGSEFARKTMESIAIQMGSPAVSSSTWMEKLGRLGTTQWLVISSHPKSTLPEELASQLGKPVAHLSSSDKPSWYQPPIKEKKEEKKEEKKPSNR
jgi:uncharacterized protein (DUF58 family)